MTTLLAFLLALHPVPQAKTPELAIDPLLLVEAAKVFERIADDDPIWPGWKARATPILFSLPGVQDALVNHPRPPEGFTRAKSPLDLHDGRRCSRSTDRTRPPR